MIGDKGTFDPFFLQEKKYRATLHILISKIKARLFKIFFKKKIYFS